MHIAYLEGLHDSDHTGDKAPPVLSILLLSSPLCNTEYNRTTCNDNINQ